MTNDLIELVDELQQRVTELEQRVETLEGNGSTVTNTGGGLDHRDQAVLSAVRRKAGDPGPRQTLRLYLSQTDISQRETAKRRAKSLRKTDSFSEAVER